MAKAAVFLIDGFEEIEALTVVDILRRGGVETTTVSLSSGLSLTGKHGVVVQADRLLSGLVETDYDTMVIPGGTTDYLDHGLFMEMIGVRGRAGRAIAAICAAPVVLGRLGLLKGKKAVCYPGLEFELEGARIPQDLPAVVTDDHITTSRGPATALTFALRVLELTAGPERAYEVGRATLLHA